MVRERPQPEIITIRRWRRSRIRRDLNFPPGDSLIILNLDSKYRFQKSQHLFTERIAFTSLSLKYLLWLTATVIRNFAPPVDSKMEERFQFVREIIVSSHGPGK